MVKKKGQVMLWFCPSKHNGQNGSKLISILPSFELLPLCIFIHMLLSSLYYYFSVFGLNWWPLHSLVSLICTVTCLFSLLDLLHMISFYLRPTYWICFSYRCTRCDCITTFAIFCKAEITWILLLLKIFILVHSQLNYGHQVQAQERCLWKRWPRISPQNRFSPGSMAF